MAVEPHKTNWPNSGEKLFRSDEDWHFNACINCYRPSLADMALSYKEGAETLTRATADGDATLDRVILPIVYLYRQYLELAFKAIIEDIRYVEGDGSGYPKHHNLKTLWTEAKRLIHEHYREDAPPEIEYVDPCIDEFCEHDPESFSFRYPTDKRGKPNLRDIPHINLRNLYDTMERLSSLIDCLTYDLSQKAEYMAEMRSENYD